MKSSTLAMMLFLLGVLFAGFCIFFILLPSSVQVTKGGIIDLHKNTGLGAIATGILSLGCIAASGIAIKKSKDD